MAKRGQGEGSIGKRPDGTYWARITTGYDDEGKQVRKAFYGKTRKEVQEKLTAALNEMNKGTYINPSKITVGEWLDEWLEVYKKRNIKFNTYRIYKGGIELHTKPYLGNIKLNKLKREDIQKFLNYLVDKDFSNKYIKTIIMPLQSALEQAVINEYIYKNVSLKINIPQKDTYVRDILTIEEQTEFIKAAKYNEYGDLFILILSTGLRIGEAVALTWDDIDFDKKTLNINKTAIMRKNSKTDINNSTNSPKTKSSIRTIPLNDDLIKLFKKKQTNSERNTNNLLFTGRRNKKAYLGRRTISYYLNLLLKYANINKNITCHSLRHTFATRGLEAGVDMKIMQEFMGHSSIKMTSDLYTHVLPDKKKEAIEKLQNVIDINKNEHSD